MEQKNKSTKNMGGRPKVAVKKNQAITVKCSATEKTIIKGKARVMKLTASQFLRRLGVDGKIDRPKNDYPKEVLQLIKLLNNTASNINQIAKKLNDKGDFTLYWQQQLTYHLAELKKTEQQINFRFQ